MIKNISYNDKVVRSDINALVGKPFPMIERFRMGGIGSIRIAWNIHQEIDPAESRSLPGPLTILETTGIPWEYLEKKQKQTD